MYICKDTRLTAISINSPLQMFLMLPAKFSNISKLIAQGRPRLAASMGSFKNNFNNNFKNNFSTAAAAISHYDTVIIGGGAVGSSIAYHLSLLAPNSKIAVIERDNAYKICSAMLSAASIRQQFSVPENIKMSSYGIKFIKDIANKTNNEIQFHEIGYLFLGGENGRKILQINNKTQHDCGATWIKLLEKKDLSNAFPWINLDGIDIGSYGTENEGYFDPWSFVNINKREAAARGVEFINAEAYSAKISPVSNGSISEFNLSSIKLKGYGNSKDLGQISAKTFVNASGAWAGRLLDQFINDFSISNKKTIARLPVVPRKRCIFTVHCNTGSNTHLVVPPAISPLTIDPTGVYFRPEGKGNRFICGVSPKEENDPDCKDDSALNIVDHHLFNDTIWPVLAERIPAFECLKVTNSWAGFYDHNTLDQNGIIGQHSEIRNLILCNGFSGHGLQQSPGAGRGASELIEFGHFKSLDLKRFGFERIVNNKPIYETGIV